MIVEKQLVLEMLVDESLEMIVDESSDMIVDESLDMIVDESFDMIVDELLDMIVDESLMVEDKSLEKLVDETLKLDEEHFESDRTAPPSVRTKFPPPSSVAEPQQKAIAKLLRILNPVVPSHSPLLLKH
ncbi:hypothetical protein Tco_1145843 [Tanacetum coccineum]